MLELIHLVQQGSCKHQDKIKALIDPLESLFGINAHAYYRIDSQGFLTYLSNLPQIAEYYFANHLYLENPFLKHPDIIQSGYVLATGVENSSFQHGQSRIEQKYQLNNHLLIFEKEEGILHAHGFATNCKDTNLMNMYLNNLGKLRLYCRHFRQETDPIQKKIQNLAVDFGSHIGPKFQKLTPSGKHVNKDADFKLFSLLNKSSGGLELVNPLTKRELECLQLLLDGLSASQIGDQLYISSRTVEHHILHVKDKTLCTTKNELFSYAATLKACGGNLSFLRRLWKF